MKKVLFRSSVLTQSGYGVHARQILRWLKKKEQVGLISLRTQILPWGNTPWYVNGKLCDGLVQYAMDKTGDITPPYDLTIQIQLPNEWDPRLGHMNVGVTAGVESDRCDPQWIKCMNEMSHVVVPSTHTRRTLESSGAVSTRLSVVPESFPDAIFNAKRTTTRFSTPWNILVHGQLTASTSDVDRKNIFNTIKWICELFKNDPDVGIVLKTNMGRNTLIDRLTTKSVLEAALRECRIKKNPIIHLVHGMLSDEENISLYLDESVKCLVSLTRGEGFGLTTLEAAACGLPIIATNWSAHLDYLGDSFTKVDYSIIPIPSQRIDDKIFVKGSMWADPSEIDFKTKMKRFRIDGKNERNVANDLKERLLRTHCQSAIEESWDSAIGYVFT